MELNIEVIINPCTYNQPIFDKSAQTMCYRNDNLFSKWCWQNWMCMCGRMKLDPCHHIKNNSRWIKDLNLRPKIMKLLEKMWRKHFKTLV